MTECERIIKEGILPVSFFQPETICDFYVDENRKKLWAVLIDLLIKFDYVCRKYNLKYCLAFGGLLGIVRHDGFIPWDDDLDVVMPRTDYEKLINLYKDDFQDQYVLQVPLKDDGYYYSYAKLRNSNTTGISKNFRYQNFNQGLFLDIFPVDNCYLEEIEENAKKIKHLLIENSTNMKRSNPFPTFADIQRFNQYPKRDPKLIFKEVDRISKRRFTINTEYVTVSVITIYHPTKMTWRSSTLFDVIEKSFYGHNIYIPRDFDSVLRTTYGDYYKFPPIEARGSWHPDLLMDPDIPYTIWVNRLREQDLENNKNAL